MNNFLVTGVQPASNEMNVSLDQRIVITFQKHMDQASIGPSKIRLRVVNGALVPTTHAYDGMTRRLTISHEGLQAGTQYQLEIIGGENGINSILGEYMSTTRFYEFTTTTAGAPPRFDSVIHEVDGPYVSVRWVMVGAGSNDELSFKLSTSSDPSMPGVFPTSGNHVVSGDSVDIPRRLNEGEYHIHSFIRRSGSVVATNHLSFRIDGEEDVSDPGAPPTDGENGYETLKLLESFPKNGAFEVQNNTMLGLRFSEALDKEAYEETWVTVREKDQGFFGGVSATLTLVEDPRPEVLAFEVEGLLEDTVYEIVLSKDIKGLEGTDSEQEVDGMLIIISGEAKTLGKPERIEFVTRIEPMYVSVEELKIELGPVAELYSDIELYKRIGYASKAAYEIVSRTRRFDETQFTDGSFPFYMKEYVKYSLAYDLVVQGMTSGSNTSGARISLGDLSVSREEGSGSLQRDMLKVLRDKVKIWQDMLHGVTGRGYAMMTSAVDQETGNPYPDFFEGYSEYPELGG